MKYKELETCAKCSRSMVIVTRGLCGTCYRHETAAGTLDYWPRTIRTVADAVRESYYRYGGTMVDFCHPNDYTRRAWAAQQMQKKLGMNKTEIAEYFKIEPKTAAHWLKQKLPPELPPPWPARKWENCVVCGRSPTRIFGLCVGHTERWRKTKRLNAEIPLRKPMPAKKTDQCRKSMTGYSYGCRCQDCRNAAAAVKREMRRSGEKLVLLTEALPKIQAFRDAGYTYREIAGLVGVSEETIYSWRCGRSKRGRREAVARLLAIPKPCQLCREPAFEDGKWCWTCFKIQRAA